MIKMSRERELIEMCVRNKYYCIEMLEENEIRLEWSLDDHNFMKQAHLIVKLLRNSK